MKMIDSIQSQVPTTGRFQRLRQALVGVTTVLLLAASFPSGAAAAGEHEYDAAVTSFRTGRTSEAFGQFMSLANHGDADAARIALFMYNYGNALYGKEWDVLPSAVASWDKLVRDSGTPGRQLPEFQTTVLTPASPAADMAGTRQALARPVQTTRAD
jgi:hypothetical protein